MKIVFIILISVINCVFGMDYFEKAMIESDTIFNISEYKGKEPYFAVSYDSIQKIATVDYLFSNSDSTDKYLYYYDSTMFNYLTKQIKYNGDVVVQDSFYSSEPNIRIKCKISPDSGKAIFEQKYWFNNNSKLVKDSIIIIEQYEIPYYSIYTYDESNNLILKERFNLEDSLQQKYEYFYEDDLLKEIVYIRNNWMNGDGKDSLFYSEDNRLSSIRYYSYDKSNTVYKFNYETQFGKAAILTKLSGNNGLDKKNNYSIILKNRLLEITGDDIKSLKIFNMQGELVFNCKGNRKSNILIKNIYSKGTYIVDINGQFFKAINILR